MPPPVSKLESLARGTAADVRAMDAGALNALIPAMRAAQKEIADDLQKWLTKLGPAAMDDKFTVAQLRHAQVLLGIAEGQAANRRAGFPAAAQRAVQSVMGQAQAPRRAAQTLVHQLDQLGSKFADMPGLQLTHAAIMAKGDRMVTDRYPASAARYSGQVRDDLKFQFAVGLAKGESVNDLVTRISRLGGVRQAVDAKHPPNASKAMASGLHDRYHHWANRLVRTELVNAYNYTTVQGLKAAAIVDPQLLMKWDASLDARVCTTCHSLHGKTAKPGGTINGYAQPPAHPHCRCTLVAWSSDWGDDDAVPEVPSAEDVLAEEKKRAQGARQQSEQAREKDKSESVQEREARAPRMPRDRKPPMPEVTWGPEWEKRTQWHMDFQTMLNGMNPADRAAMLDQARSTTATAAGNVTYKSLAAFVENNERIARELAAQKAWRAKYDPVYKAQVKTEQAAQKAKDREARKLEREEERAAAREKARADKATAHMMKVHGVKDARTARSLAAIEKEKASPIKTTYHPNFSDPSGLITPSKKEKFEQNLLGMSGKRITLEEVTHAFGVPDGYSAKLTSVGEASIKFKVYTKNGDYVAEVNRSFYPGQLYDAAGYPRGKGMIAKHDLFWTEKEYQDKGLSDYVIGNSFRHYEKWGVEQVGVYTADVGRYAWARLGFHYEDPNRMVERFGSFLEVKKQEGRISEVDAKDLLHEVRTNLVKKPWEFAKMAHGDNFPDEFNHPPMEAGFNIGKAFMLSPHNSGWEGYMAVDRKNPGYMHALSQLEVEHSPTLKVKPPKVRK